MKIVEKKDTKLAFACEIEESLANAIRRYTFEIPVLAIDEVEIAKNDSALYDETIAHRLGLVPIILPKTVPKTKTLSLSLASKKEGLVYSGELKGEVKVSYDQIPLTDLTKGQEISLKAFLRLGKGKEHSKFSPGLMVYRNVMDISGGKTDKTEAASVQVMNVKEQGDGKAALANELEGTYKGAKGETFSIVPSKELLITLESFGQMPVQDMFNKAIAELKDDLSEVSKKVK